MANETKKKGLFAKIIEGPERSEDYARNTLPSSRWALGWDLVKTNFGKIVKINLLMFLFLFPLFLLFILRSVLISAEAYGAPFSQNMGIGYPIIPSMVGIEQNILIRVDVIFFVLLFALSFYMAVGISGGFYVMRNLVWTEGVFVTSDFWTGVKKNYKTVISSTLTFVVLLGISIITIDVANYQIATGQGNSIFLTVSKIVSIVGAVFLAICYLYSLTLGVTYKLKYFKLLRNSAICTIALIPTNLFFGALSMALFTILLFEATSIFFMVGVFLVILLSISIMTLIWTNYSQWVFDEFVNDKVAGAKKNRGIYKKNQVQEVEEEFDFSTTTFYSKHVKPITDTEIEIETLQEGYSRKDLVRLQESKKAMMDDSDRYAEERKKKVEQLKQNGKKITDLVEEDKKGAKQAIDTFMQSDEGEEE